MVPLGKTLGLFRGSGGNSRLQMVMIALNDGCNDRPKNAPVLIDTTYHGHLLI